MTITKHNPHPKNKIMNALFVGRNVMESFARNHAVRRTKMITKKQIWQNQYGYQTEY